MNVLVVAVALVILTVVHRYQRTTDQPWFVHVVVAFFCISAALHSSFIITDRNARSPRYLFDRVGVLSTFYKPSAEVVLYYPVERLSGAAVYYLERTVSVAYTTEELSHLQQKYDQLIIVGETRLLPEHLRIFELESSEVGGRSYSIIHLHEPIVGSVP